MKSSFLVLLLMVCTYFPLKAQMNLVPNPSFEDVAFCPNGLGQLYLANNWDNFGISPDLFCSCSPIGVNVPFNNAGFQYANSGNCMAGLITFHKFNSPLGPNEREFIGAELLQQLVTGNKYYFSCYINFPCGQVTNVATSNFGMKLLTNPSDSLQYSSLITNSAFVLSNVIISDTTSWIKIQGSFVADSSYSIIAIGNFYTDNITDTVSCGLTPPEYGYYFIDDICLSTDSLYCENWTSYQELSGNDSKLIIFPNPVLSTLNITSELEIKSIAVKNVFGRQLLNYEGITETSTIINLEELPSGIYIVEIDLGESILNRKIIKL